MCIRDRLFAVLASPSAAAQGLVSAGQAEFDPLYLGFSEVDQGLTFDDPSFATIPNAVAHTQDMVVSHAGWQYVAYWDADRRLTVARRELPAIHWEVLAFDDYSIAGQDAHNAVSIGICPGDGTIHLAFDHHTDPLHYRRSAPRAASEPALVAWEASLFGPVVDVLDPAHGKVTSVTYPRFFPTPDGGLQLVYRQFGSGNGRLRLVDYDAAAGSWSNDRVFIERTGPHADPLGGSSSSRNPYLNRIAYDDQGTLHATWTWREKAPVPYNRDIAYAYSEDGGTVWFNGADQVIADTSAGTAIDAQSPGIRAVELGAEYGLMNSQAQVVDGRGRVHVVMYHKDEPDDVVSYGNVFNSHYNHYWRDADGVWRSFRLATIGNRPKLFAGAHGDLVLAYRAPGGDLRLDRATPEGDYLDWTTAASFPGGFGTSAQGDHPRFESSGVLSVAVQESPAAPGAPSSLGVIDAVLEPDPACTAVDQACAVTHALAVERDTYVRGGAFASETYGAEPRLSVQEALSEDETRLAFLRFYLGDLAGHGRVTAATLRLHLAARGPDPGSTRVEARRCALDTWPEYTTSWTNKPVPNGPAHPGDARGRTVDVDVTAAVALELAKGGQRITFEVAGTRPGRDRWVDLHAREAGPQTAPVLLVHQENALPPVADAYVRAGAFAATNFGAEDRLVVKESASADFDRVAYLRFDLAPLEGTGTIERVFLDGVSPVMGPLGRTTPIVAHAVADDAWQEELVTWNDRPALGSELAAHYGRPGMRWDVTVEALAALAGDGLLSLGLRSDREGAERTVHLWAREAAGAELRPRLLVRYAPSP